MPADNIPVVGIAGGIASGKSLVSEHLTHKGAAVISADALAHEVLRVEDVKRQIRDRFGDEVFTPNGEVDRAALGRIVFATSPEGASERKALEQLTHPRIGAMAREQIDRVKAEGRAKAIVLDVPLLFESGWNRVCDKVVFVDAPRQARLARAMARGWTEEEFDRREAAQGTLDEKRSQANWIIDNSGTVDAARSEIELLWDTLVGSDAGTARD